MIIATPDTVPAATELVHELRRQEENCSYSAASLYLWVKFLRGLKAILLTAQVIFGALAAWKVLAKDYHVVTAVFALLAGIIAPLLSATKISGEITAAKAAADNFTNLRDRFRRAALVDVHKPFSAFEGGANVLFDRMDKVRAASPTAPELFFALARRKIRKGHFKHDYDEETAP